MVQLPFPLKGEQTSTFLSLAFLEHFEYLKKYVLIEVLMQV